MKDNTPPEMNDDVRDKALLDTFRRIAKGKPQEPIRQKGDERPAQMNRVEEK